MTFQLGNSYTAFVDKRRKARDDSESRQVGGPTLFTANAGGTTTTIVGSNGFISGGVNTNIVRVGDEFKLFNSSSVLKEETVFRITDVATAGSTTITFTPAAAVATANGDIMRLVGPTYSYSSAEKDRRLIQLGFSAARVAILTENDKDYQLRVSDDAGSI